MHGDAARDEEVGVECDGPDWGENHHLAAGLQSADEWADGLCTGRRGEDERGTSQLLQPGDDVLFAAVDVPVTAGFSPPGYPRSPSMNMI